MSSRVLVNVLQVLEHVHDVRSLDVHTLLAVVVGAIQHLSQLHDELAGRMIL